MRRPPGPRGGACDAELPGRGILGGLRAWRNGRRAVFRCPCSKERGGSSPSARTFCGESGQRPPNFRPRPPSIAVGWSRAPRFSESRGYVPAAGRRNQLDNSRFRGPDHPAGHGFRIGSARAPSARWAACVTKSVGLLGRCPNQCFLECRMPSVGVWSVLARFSARFSLRDLPGFLDMLCRGDLSDMTGPFIRGPGWSLSPDHTRTADGEATPLAAVGDALA